MSPPTFEPRSPRIHATRSSCSHTDSSLLTEWRFVSLEGMRYVSLKSAKSDLRCCLPMRCCFGGMGVSGVFCSSLNRLSDVVVLMASTLSVLLTAGVGLIELSLVIELFGLRVDTELSVFIVIKFGGETLVCQILFEVVKPRVKSPSSCASFDNYTLDVGLSVAYLATCFHGDEIAFAFQVP